MARVTDGAPDVAADAEEGGSGADEGALPGGGASRAAGGVVRVPRRPVDRVPALVPAHGDNVTTSCGLHIGKFLTS